MQIPAQQQLANSDGQELDWGRGWGQKNFIRLHSGRLEESSMRLAQNQIAFSDYGKTNTCYLRAGGRAALHRTGVAIGARHFGRYSNDGQMFARHASVNNIIRKHCHQKQREGSDREYKAAKPFEIHDIYLAEPSR